MAGRNLRRSRRSGGNSGKRTSAYNVDDIVEISRGNATVKARLAQLLSDPASPNPRWLIKFDGLSLKDEEVYEHSFAKNNAISSDNSNSDREIYNRGRPTRNSRGYGSDHDNNTHHNHHHHHHHHSSNVPSEESETGGESSRTRAKRALAREARSKRRQAKIDRTSTPTSGVAAGKRRLPPPPPPNHPSRQKGKRAKHNNNGNGNSGNNDEEDGEVVKVKLLTGTLYLYRGLHRRAEFIRKV